MITIAAGVIMGRRDKPGDDDICDDQYKGDELYAARLRRGAEAVRRASIMACTMGWK